MSALFCAVAYKGRYRGVVGYTEWRRNFYLAKIKEIEEQAAQAAEEDAIKGFLTVAEGYRALLKRLGSPGESSE